MDFKSIARFNFDQALLAGLPVFMPSEKESSPLNSTPYLAPLSHFVAIASEWPGRSDLINSLLEIPPLVEQQGARIDFAIIGGSMLDLENPHPNDLDCVLLYTEAGDIQPHALTKIQSDAKLRRLDLRFIPMDADPAALLKSVMFFTILYSKSKFQNSLTRGIVLLDCQL